MRKSLRCTFAAIATAVALAISPAAGLALADPTEPTIPVIPVPEPLPVEPAPVQEEVPAPPIQDIPAYSPPAQELPPEPVQVQEPPPVVDSVPDYNPVPEPTVPEPTVPTVQEEPQAPPVQQAPSLPEPVEQEAPPANQAEPSEPVAPTEDAPDSPLPAEQPDSQEPVLPRGEEQSPQPSESAPAEDQPEGSAPDGEPPTEAEPLPSLNPQDDSTEGVPSPADGTEPSDNPSLPDENQSDTQDTVATEPVDMPKPDEGPKPVPKEFLEQEPVTVLVHDANQEAYRDPKDRDNRHGDKDRPWPPKPGKDEPKNPWKHDKIDRFPASADIDIKADVDNSITVINNITNITQIDNSVTNNINIVNVDVTKIENRQDWLYLRNFDHPDRVLRVPVEYGKPARLSPGWCGGVGGAWSFSAAVAGSNLAASFAGSGVFYANSGCGYTPRPKPPQHYPERLYICPPKGHRGPPVYQGKYVYIDNTTVYAPEYNTYYYGSWETRNVNQKPQKAFVTTAWSPDTVFQQKPIPGPPPPIKSRWGGYESSQPTGIMAAVQYARDNKPISIAVAVLIGAAAVWGATSIARNRKQSNL